MMIIEVERDLFRNKLVIRDRFSVQFVSRQQQELSELIYQQWHQ